jgi:hypothetical protein
MSDDINERLARLLRSLKLQDIKPMSLHADRLGDMPAPNSEINLEWKQAFADGDPVSVNGETRAFRPRYEITVSFQGIPIFLHVSIFIVTFQLTDVVAFDQLWADEEVRRVFMQNQIQKTLWPFIRQLVHDGMSRLGINPIPLPWLL